MTFPEFAAARQLLLEEHIGASVRADIRREDQAIEGTVAAIRQAQGNGAR